MNIKKILSLVLCVAMILSTMSFNVFAEEATYVAKIGDVSYESFSDALAAAKLMTDEVTVEIYEKVTLNSSLSGDYSSIKFVGKSASAEIYLDVQGYITATGKAVAFEDLTLSKSEGGFITNAGFMNVAFGIYDVNSVSYTNCTFSNGAYASSGDVTFTGCTFYRSHDKYGLWAYGDVDAIVDGCVFDDYRGVKMYAEGKAKTTNLTVKDTDFSQVNDKPAIVLTYGESVILEGNTYSSTGVFELDKDGAPNGTSVTSTDDITCVNDDGACGVLVGNKIYTKLADAVEVAKEGDTVTLLHDSTEEVTFAPGVVLDKNGFSADNATVLVPTAKIGDTNYKTLQEAIDKAKNGDTIILVSDCDEDVTVVQSPDVAFTINGDNKTVSGAITINGKSAAYATAGLTIKNVNFDAKSITKDASINFGVSGDNNTRYISNVTVTGCTFTGEGNAKVGIKSYTGGDKNITIENCTATGMHSLAQLKNAAGLTVSGCKVEGKNGISIGASTDVSISSCAMTCSGYGVRADASGAYTLTVTGSSINANYPVIARKATNPNYQLTIGEGCEFTSSSGYDIAVTTGDDEAPLEKPTEDIKLTVDKTVEVSVFSSYVASVDGVCYTTLKDAFEAAKQNSTIALLADIDLADTEWEPVSFGGKFNGNGHTISNLKIYKPGVKNTGFITSLNNSFENVIFKNVDVTGGECTGVVAGRAGGSASLAKNITVTGSIKVETTHSGYARAGVIVGGWAYGRYIDITVDGIDANTSYIKHTGGGDGRYVAGIVGHADDVDEYTNCVVKNITIDGDWLCGGIAGPGPASSTASGCVVENVKIAADYSGGMFGWYYTPVSEPGLIDDCSVKNIEFTEGATGNGAIGGYAMDTDVVVTNTTIENVVNYGGAPLIGFVVTVVDKDGNKQSCGTLQAALDAAKAGDKIILEGDVTESVTVKAPVATYALRSTPSGVTIDLNNFTLTGDIIVEAGATATIKNGTIINENSDVSAIQSFGTTTLEDVDVTSARHAVRVEGGLTTIESGSYKVGTAGMTTYAVNVSDGGEVVINGGVFEGPAKTEGADSGAAVNVKAGSKVTINGGKFSGGKNNTLSGKGTLVVNEGMFDQDVLAYIAETSEAIDRGAYEYPYGVAKKAAGKINVTLEKTANKNVYDIVINSDGKYNIYEFVSAELTFANNSTTVGGSYMDYEIRGYAANKTFAQEAKNAVGLEENEEQYVISLADGAERLSGDGIIIGQVEFFGQGDIDFTITKGEVDTTWQNTNLGRYYVNDGDPATTDDALVLGDDASINDNIPEVNRDVAINVAFNHNIDTEKYWGNYQITATIKNNAMGFTKTEDIKIKDIKSGACVFENVPVGYITVTLKAPGFRTFTYETTLEETSDNGVLVLNFWNDVKRGNDEVIEKGKAEMAHNFLVGDIVMDMTVDKYDLAAVTSYYGTYDIDEAQASKYIKYDLNRDGDIDIRDVQYVLHTMGN